MNQSDPIYTCYIYCRINNIVYVLGVQRQDTMSLIGDIELWNIPMFYLKTDKSHGIEDVTGTIEDEYGINIPKECIKLYGIDVILTPDYKRYEVFNYFVDLGELNEFPNIICNKGTKHVEWTSIYEASRQEWVNKQFTNILDIYETDITNIWRNKKLRHHK